MERRSEVAGGKSALEGTLVGVPRSAIEPYGLGSRAWGFWVWGSGGVEVLLNKRSPEPTTWPLQRSVLSGRAGAHLQSQRSRNLRVLGFTGGLGFMVWGLQ